MMGKVATKQVAILYKQKVFIFVNVDPPIIINHNYGTSFWLIGEHENFGQWVYQECGQL